MNRMTLFPLFTAALLAAFVQPTMAQTALERGTYLINALLACSACHTPTSSTGVPLAAEAFAGGTKFTSPVFEAYSANLTPDPDTGLGKWTDDQIIRAFREGIDDKGHPVGPPMPVAVYNNMSDDDARAVVAYLRSLTAVHNAVSESAYKTPIATLPPAKGHIAPPVTDRVAYGGYIAKALVGCLGCHTTPVNGTPDMVGHLGAGGMQFALADGKFVLGANITSDPDTGIGKWADADVIKAMTRGIDPAGRHLSPVMPFNRFKNMTPDDLGAVVAFVRTLKPISNKVEPSN